MRKTAFIILALFIIFIGCASDKDMLLQRAAAWSDLGRSTDSNSDEAVIISISKFLEPSAANSERATQFYKDWIRPDRPKELAYSIDDITIDNDKEHAIVTYRFVLENEAGTKQIETQITFWKKVNGQWYRTITPSL